MKYTNNIVMDQLPSITVNGDGGALFLFYKG